MESTNHANREKPANRLIHEKSPYLLQHAYNPVDWYPWGEEAFDTARRLNRPVFLSIGYATCHWCHVMEKESFEDAEVAELMNRAFISIKVDREERPDLDHIYMAVCQMLTGSGGWPLTVVLTPDRQPFFAATYLPKHSRFGRAGMMEFIPKIEEVWKDRRDEVMTSVARIGDALEAAAHPEGGEDLEEGTLNQAFQELSASFDERHGGFGKTPKFPSPHNLLFLLRYWKRTGRTKALDMLEASLQAMARGGLFDHVGFGFHRYATDREWLVPHFEKMLYDQAMLAITLVEAWQVTGKDLYRRRAEQVFAYVLRDMTTPEGGFCAAEDADSEGEEGRFYVWTEQEIRETLPKEEADLAIRAFCVTPEGNYLDEATQQRTGANILHLEDAPEALADELGLSAEALEERLDAALRALFAARGTRVRPLRDDKVLTDWNGLMIAALARGAQAFEEPQYAEAADRAARFLLKRLKRPDGGLLHRFREGEAGIEAHLDDYAFLIWGLIELYEAIFDPEILEEALALAEGMQVRFLDPERGGFFFTPEDGEALIVRKKEFSDAAVPSGNSVAALDLLRLARLTGRSGLESIAAEVFRAVGGGVRRFPSAFTFLLAALDFALGPTREIVVAGDPDHPDTQALLRVLRRRFLPGKVVLLRPSGRGTATLDRLAPYTQHHDPVNGRAAAYVCFEHACKAPMTDPQELAETLDR